jgi:murein L,D-transpeptidase YcbB/YkuD
MKGFTLHKAITVLILSISALHFCLQKHARAQDLDHEIRQHLRNRIQKVLQGAGISVGQELIHASVVLPHFYEQREFEPAWSRRGIVKNQADDLLAAISAAGSEGLEPEDYHLKKIEEVAGELRKQKIEGIEVNPARLADLDLLLTDAFLLYGSHLLTGKVNPESIDSEWHADRREADMARILQHAVESKSVEKNLKMLLPPLAGYLNLKHALVRYQDILENGGWSAVPEGQILKKGDQNDRVAELGLRLAITGDIDQSPETGPDLFDHLLEAGVKRFQKRHGLDVDGVVGPATLAALNVSARERVVQIKLNMERWRWLPQDLGERHILVNLANFELDLIEGEKVALVMRVIVGKGYRRTPVFSAKITHLVFNPYWHIPHNIAVKDKLPLIKKDSGYLNKENIEVFQGWGEGTKRINPATIDWRQITANNFPFRLRQEPGPWNALGCVKFMFPNRFNVYLHDTPSRELFQKTDRAFSSGCIRIEKPVELAEYLLRDDAQWTKDAIFQAIARRTEQTVRLPSPMPVHLLYWTAWADKDQLVHFRRDIYSRDKRLRAALEKGPETRK